MKDDRIATSLCRNACSATCKGEAHFTPLSTTVGNGKPLFTTALKMPKTGYS
jgi:hypothetical protein